VLACLIGACAGVTLFSAAPVLFNAMSSVAILPFVSRAVFSGMSVVGVTMLVYAIIWQVLVLGGRADQRSHRGQADPAE
jgi:ABC-type transport system involved in Fe-S cluster assembly fused permease/ATPase subunit